MDSLHHQYFAQGYLLDWHHDQEAHCIADVAAAVDVPWNDLIIIHDAREITPADYSFVASHVTMMLLDCSIDDCCDESDGMMMMNDDADVVGHDSDRQLEMVNALYCNDDCHLRHWDGTDHDYIRDGLMNRMNNSIVHHHHVIDNHHLDHSSSPYVTHVVDVDTVHWKSNHRGDSVVAHISYDSHEIDDSQDWAIGLYHHGIHRDISIHTSSLWLHTVLAAAHYYYE